MLYLASKLPLFNKSLKMFYSKEFIEGTLRNELDDIVTHALAIKDGLPLPGMPKFITIMIYWSYTEIQDCVF